MTKKIITLALILASLISCNTFGYNDKLDANNQEAIPCKTKEQ